MHPYRTDMYANIFITSLLSSVVIFVSLFIASGIENEIKEKYYAYLQQNEINIENPEQYETDDIKLFVLQQYPNHYLQMSKYFDEVYDQIQTIRGLFLIPTIGIFFGSVLLAFYFEKRYERNMNKLTCGCGHLYEEHYSFDSHECKQWSTCNCKTFNEVLLH